MIQQVSNASIGKRSFSSHERDTKAFGRTGTALKNQRNGSPRKSLRIAALAAKYAQEMLNDIFRALLPVS
jgi:hypothetical protein